MNSVDLHAMVEGYPSSYQLLDAKAEEISETGAQWNQALKSFNIGSLKLLTVHGTEGRTSQLHKRSPHLAEAEVSDMDTSYHLDSAKRVVFAKALCWTWCASCSYLSGVILALGFANLS